MGSCAPQLVSQQLILLNNHRMGDSGMKKVISQYNTRAVKQLNVAANNLTYFGLRSFSNAKWTSLTLLNLNKNKLGDKGCKYLSQTALGRMQWLVLSQNNIGNAGCLHLSKAVWKSLKYLYISFNNIQQQGAVMLTRVMWTSIKQVQGYKNPLDSDIPLISTIIRVDYPTKQQVTEDSHFLGLKKQQQNNCWLETEDY